MPSGNVGADVSGTGCEVHGVDTVDDALGALFT
jgi:hypothetical protein